MPRENQRKTGKDTEDIAAAYLTERGVRILERNFRSKDAEIDIIARQEETLLFVEVKARRRGAKNGTALEAVGPGKQKKICRCADYYMHQKEIDPFRTKIRFDVVAITFRKEESREREENCEVLWLRDAFSYRSGGQRNAPWRVW